jgi:hypothetical protein
MVSGESSGIARDVVVNERHTITVNTKQRFIANSRNQMISPQHLQTSQSTIIAQSGFKLGTAEYRRAPVLRAQAIAAERLLGPPTGAAAQFRKDKSNHLVMRNPRRKLPRVFLLH